MGLMESLKAGEISSLLDMTPCEYTDAVKAFRVLKMCATGDRIRAAGDVKSALVTQRLVLDAADTSHSLPLMQQAMRFAPVNARAESETTTAPQCCFCPAHALHMLLPGTA